MLRMPEPRGPLSAALIDVLRGTPGPVRLPPADPADPLADDDFQLALTLCYELHYRGLPGVDERWEWEPGLLAARAGLERVFEDALRDAVPRRRAPEPGAMDVALRGIAAEDDGPSLSRFLQKEGEAWHVREFVVHRSIYQLKEADPHSWAIPRLSGGPKAALVEVQADEYGGGRPDRVHAHLFAKTLRALGLDDRYGAYADHVGGPTLATVNLMSLCGLHRRLRGAIVGHLALFEMTSAVPNRRYGDALRRLGLDSPDAVDFFDEHVEADAVHESVAAVDLAGGLARDEPALAADIVWGACALNELEGRWARTLLDAWSSGAGSLRRPLADVAVLPTSSGAAA
jgi:hypothetical protein